MVQFAILNWLLPHISNYVTQQQPKTVPELLQAARIAELTTPVAKEMDSGISLQQAGVQDQLKKNSLKNDILRLRLWLLKHQRKRQYQQHP